MKSSLAKFRGQYIWRFRGVEISLGKKQLHRSQESFPAFCRSDIEAYFERMRQRMLSPIEHLLRGGPDMAQNSLVQFAQILKWWPTMVETAKRLRAEGYRLAQPI